MISKPKPSADFDTADRTDTGEKRHPQDSRLRACGFKIHSRPIRRGEAEGPTTWERDGRVYTEDEALGIVERMEMERKAAIDSSAK